MKKCGIARIFTLASAFVLIMSIMMVVGYHPKQSKESFQISKCSKNIKGKPTCLNDLNTWAKHHGPETRLNRWCENANSNGKDLRVGQYCHANCHSVKGGPTWNPGGKIMRHENGFKWEKGPGYWLHWDGSLRLTKNGYCDHV